MSLLQSGLRAALTALDTYPWVRESVETSLAQQAARVAERLSSFQGRKSTLAELDAVIRRVPGGLVALEAPPGGGVTTLLAHLAAVRPAAFWFADDDSGQGTAALCAQLIGLYHPTVALVPPAANSDPSALENLLREIAERHTAEEPIVLLIDPPTCPNQPRFPSPPLLPPTIPPRVVMVYGCTPETPLPFEPVARIQIPLTGDDVAHDQRLVLQARACPAAWHNPLLAAAQGNMLYLSFACHLLQHSILDVLSLPIGIESLYATWWNQLDSQGQRLALLLTAAGEPLPVDLCTNLLGTNPLPLLQAWGPLVAYHESVNTATWYHWSLRGYLAQHQQEALTHIHAAIAEAAPLSEQPPPPASPGAETYLARQAARHAALGTAHTRHTLLPRVAKRTWIRDQERRTSTLAVAANDLAWNISAAATPDAPRPDIPSRLLRLMRSTLLAGTLRTLARTLLPDAAVAALRAVSAQGSRETGLKRVLEVVDQLPDGYHKAQVLRQLGEVCYAERMRTSAMRLLSQALDLEEKRLPPSWREQHDHILLEMVQTALDKKSVEAALEISECIDHKEQRGMAETHTVRFLIKCNELVRARRIASNISHENLRAWALAEVVAAVARSGDLYTAEMLLNDIQIETARSWAEIELACLIAQQDEKDARTRIDRLENDNQRDHGLARLSLALAQAGKENEALVAATQVKDVATRVSALLDLRHTLGNLVALVALKQAAAAIGELPNDERIPLVSLLAAAYASLGHHKQALSVARQLPEGEEQDRAFSRVAVALARYGNHADSLAITRALPDTDERDWTLGELSCVLAAQGYWQESQAFALEIHDEKDRARIVANLSIALARTGATLAALWLTRNIPLSAERARALTMIAPLLVKAGHRNEALDMYKAEQSKTTAQQSDCLPPSHLNRYLTALAIAIAEQGDLALAQSLATSMPFVFDQARVYMAIARSTIIRDPVQAHALVGLALRSAAIDRSYTFRLIELAIPILAKVGTTANLVELAKALHESDSWW